jgi:hypothetical protein
MKITIGVINLLSVITGVEQTAVVQYYLHLLKYATPFSFVSRSFFFHKENA